MLPSEPPLGSGAFGFCVRGRFRSDGSEFAVKVLLRTDSTVYNEITMLRWCRGHPNVLRLVNDLRDRQFAYIITECLNGGDLAKQAVPTMDADGHLVVANVVRQLVAGLGHIHRCGVAHRDLKPGNIVFKGDASRRLCIIDFGLAARITNRVAMNRRVGTLDYAAPEILHGRTVTEACDIWALGATVYHWLCQQRPFGDLWQHRRWLSLPPQWKRLIRDLLTSDVVARKEALAALANELGP